MYVLLSVLPAVSLSRVIVISSDDPESYNINANKQAPAAEHRETTAKALVLDHRHRSLWRETECLCVRCKQSERRGECIGVDYCVTMTMPR